MPEEWHHHAAKLEKWRATLGPECARAGFSGDLEARKAYGAINDLTGSGFWRFCFEGGEEFAELDHRIEARSRECFRPAIEELEEVASRDLAAWKRGRHGAPTVATAAL